MITRLLSLFSNEPESSADELLKLATAKRDRGDLDGAIEALRQARLTMSPDVYPVEAFLKLPMYLHHAGRFQEAWSDIGALLRDFRYSTTKLNEQSLPMARFAIYDKMRLMLQREKRRAEAVRYGVLASVSWAQGLQRQRRRDEFRGMADKEWVKAEVENLLKRTKATGAVQIIAEIALTALKKPADVDFAAVGDQIDRAIAKAMSEVS